MSICQCDQDCAPIVQREFFAPADISSGRWDAILPQLSQFKLPRNKLEDLYEQ
ncbi:hypothetical protein CMV_023127, partial [Castanea mollissima]